MMTRCRCIEEFEIPKVDGIARIQTGTFKPDNYIDIAGYAACAAEVAGGQVSE